MANEIKHDAYEHFEALVEQKLWEQAASEIVNLQPADIAEIICRFELAVTENIFKALPTSIKPDVIANLDPEVAAEIIESMPSDEVSKILTIMDPDDAADVLAELDKTLSSQVIEQMNADEADDVRKLMTYPEDSAGGIMTTDLVRMHPEQTVLEALDAIASEENGEHVHQVYVTDGADRLVGTVSIWKLLQQKNRQTQIVEIMNTDILTVRSDTDQEKVARTIAKYALSVIPVVDSKKTLLGRVTYDDVMNIIQKEAEEDIFRMAGSDDEELGNSSTLRSCAIRLPWLTVTLIGGIVTASLIAQYTRYFSPVIILAAFIPNVMAMGGNTGLQSSVLLIREIASGSARRQAISKLLLHEVRTGALMGLICGIGLYFVAYGIIIINPTENPLFPPWKLTLVAAFALFIAMSFAAGFGAIVPILLDRCKIDPAVASGPFITGMNDISALLIYYAVSSVLMFELLG